MSRFYLPNILRISVLFTYSHELTYIILKSYLYNNLRIFCSKGDIDYNDDILDNEDISDHMMTNGNNNDDFDLDDDLGGPKDNLLLSGDEEGDDDDYVVDPEEQRLAEAEGSLVLLFD